MSTESKPPLGCVRDAGLIDVETPGSIAAEMDTVAALIHQLDADVSASQVDASFKSSWRDFVDEWQHFYKQSSWFDRLWYSTYEKTVEYRQRADAWRKKFVELGGRVNAPTDAPPMTTAERTTQIGKLLLWGGGIFVAYRIGSDLLRAHELQSIRAASGKRRSLNTQIARVAEQSQEERKNR